MSIKSITVAPVSGMDGETFRKHLTLRHSEQLIGAYTNGLFKVLAAYHRRLHNTGECPDHDHRDLETPDAASFVPPAGSTVASTRGGPEHRPQVRTVRPLARQARGPKARPAQRQKGAE